MKRSKFNPITLREAHRAYAESDLSLDEVGRRYGIDGSPMRVLFKRLGLATKRPGTSGPIEAKP